MSDIQQFELLIQQLMSADNNLRGQAEQSFNTAVRQFPDKVAISLLQLVRGSSNQPIRELSVILLRKTLVAKESEETGDKTRFWHKLSAETHQTIKNELLIGVEQEQQSSVRKKLADAVSELALFLSTHCAVEESPIELQWPELLPFLFRLSRSENEEQRRSALEMFSKLCLYLGDSLKAHIHVLKDVLTTGLTDQKSLKVRLAALGATVSFVQLLESPEEKYQFKDFTLMMFETVSAALNARKEEEALEALQILVELADLEPTFLRPHLITVVNAMLTIANTNQLGDAIRQLGLEFLVTLAEQRPGMVRKIPNFIQNLVPVVLNFMMDLEEEWDQEEDEEDEDEVTNHDVGDECIDRLALALGGKTIIPVLFAHVGNLLKHQDWRQRHTALMAISNVGEGCEKFLTPHLGDVLNMIAPHFRDPHHRVRWAACNTVGQMSSDFGPGLQQKFHSLLLPCLVSVMDDKDNPRVQSHAASAIINFCEHCTSDVLEPYLDGLLAKLANLLQTGKKIIQEQAITAIAAIADVVEGKFLKYYDIFMPFLKNILVHANGKDYRLLRGKAMECISLIGVAVGKDKFRQDAKDVMEVLMRTQQGALDPDDPQISFLLQAWARICKALGHEFIPYLEIVMPPLLASAKLDPDLTISDEEAESDQDGWQYIPIGDKRIGINTSVMEEKATACNMIYQYAVELKEGFFPFVEAAASILVPLVKFYFHDGVRSAAVSTMPALLEATKAHILSSGGNPAPLVNLFGHVLLTLLEAIQAEVDMDVLLLMVESTGECLDICGDSCMNELQLKTLCETAKKELKDRDARKTTRLEERQGEDFDEEEAEKLIVENEKEEELLSELAELLGKAVKYHRSAFLSPFGESLLRPVLALLQPDRPPHDRQVAICVFDDIVEFVGTSSLPLFQHFLPFILQYIGDANPGVRQASVYGIGMCAQFGGESMAPLIPDILKRLSVVITHAEARNEENIHPTENAIAAWGRICQYQPAATGDLGAALSAWLSFLPVTEDNIESVVTYGHLCYFIEAHGQALLGAEYQNLSKVLDVFATVLRTELVDDSITERMLDLMKRMQASLPPHILQNAFNSLSLEKRNKLSGGA